MQETVIAFVRAIFALPLYLFDWLCYLVAFAIKPYGPHGPSPRLAGQQQSDRVFTLPGEHEPWLSEARGELDLVERGLVILRPKQPYVQWAKRIDPEQGGDYTLAKARREDTMAFLMPSYDLGIEAAEAFVEEHWPHFFAQMLESWNFDPATWPQDRSLVMFQHWFDIELSDFILDLGQYVDADNPPRLSCPHDRRTSTLRQRSHFLEIPAYWAATNGANDALRPVDHSGGCLLLGQVGPPAELPSAPCGHP